ncbi:Hypothetical_protein [Hexamita inflata]|uniref:Hypothetical_protein n=1 Tax=Hexamita inflata TaxID=28002 RepID=A0AA86RPI7_9EUKA|nr:Hypothetical protein HINF_LOCUS63339 [Hexamita inflata]
MSNKSAFKQLNVIQDDSNFFESLQDLIQESKKKIEPCISVVTGQDLNINRIRKKYVQDSEVIRDTDNQQYAQTQQKRYFEHLNAEKIAEYWGRPSHWESVNQRDIQRASTNIQPEAIQPKEQSKTCRLTDNQKAKLLSMGLFLQQVDTRK